MIEKLFADLLRGDNIREILISIKEEIKTEKGQKHLKELLNGDYSSLTNLFLHEDPKVRKNVAAILGQLESEELLPVLFEAYESEKTLFVRPAILKAMKNADVRPYRKNLKERLNTLRAMNPLPEEQKHINEEIKALQELVLKYQKKEKHEFVGDPAKPEMILVTNRCQREATARQISGKTVMLAGGVRVNETEVGEIMKIRTWSELLFPIASGYITIAQLEKKAEAVTLEVLRFLRSTHEGIDPFYFRLELKNAATPEKKAASVKKIVRNIERASGNMLINSVNDYEVEIRLIERKDQSVLIMLKLFTIPDKRFSYRKEYIASSISPVNAALAVELAKPYLKEGAQILDPFCGVGTMLLERTLAVYADPMYGVDIYGEAIEKARTNTEIAKAIIHYINKDFFEFEHNYLFDEVITDMPHITMAKSKEEIEELYRRFFAYVPRFLKKGAVLILYSPNPELVLKNMKSSSEYHMKEKFLLNEKNQTTLFVLKYME